MWLIEDDRARCCAVLFEQFSNLIVIKFDSIPPFEFERGDRAMHWTRQATKWDDRERHEINAHF